MCGMYIQNIKIKLCLVITDTNKEKNTKYVYQTETKGDSNEDFMIT